MNDVLAVRNQVRYNEWANAISEFKNSEMSVEDWCNMVGWTRNQYFYRLRRLRELAIQSTFDSGVFAKIPDELSEEPAPATDELVTIRSGLISIEMSSNTFKENAAAILEAIEYFASGDPDRNVVPIH